MNSERHLKVIFRKMKVNNQTWSSNTKKSSAKKKNKSITSHIPLTIKKESYFNKYQNYRQLKIFQINFNKISQNGSPSFPNSNRQLGKRWKSSNTL